MQSSHLLHPSDAPLWIEEFQQAYLMQHEPVTVRVYVHILHQFTQWTMKQSGKTIIFQLEQHLTTPLIEQYLAFLTTQGYSQSHCKRVKSVIHQFCQWLIEDKGHLRRNPTRPIIIEPLSPISPRRLTPVQRYILQALIKQDTQRGKALFALGYWAGCRVTDIVRLHLSHTHVGAKSGRLHLEGADEKVRDIDLTNERLDLIHWHSQATESLSFVVWKPLHPDCSMIASERITMERVNSMARGALRSSYAATRCSRSLILLLLGARLTLR